MVWGPAWSPDDGSIISSHIECAAGEVQPYCFQGRTSIVSVRSPTGRRRSSRMSPDLVWSRSSRRTADGSPSVSKWSGERLRHGHRRQRPTPARRRVRATRWSPDGHWILFDRATGSSRSPGGAASPRGHHGGRLVDPGDRRPSPRHLAAVPAPSRAGRRHYTPGHGPPVRARPARRLRDRRVPRRPRADDHGRRPAVDPRRPRRPDRRARPGSSSARPRWIINGYLLVYILTMPLAGRLADLWGARRLFLAGARRLHRRLGARRAVADARPADRRAARPGRRRRRARAGRDRGRGAPVRRRDRPRALGVDRRADVPRHGRRAVRRAPRSSRSVHRRGGLDGAGLADPWPCPRPRPGAGSSTSTSRSGSSPCSSPGRRRPAGTRRGGRAGSTCAGAAWFGLALAAGLVGLTLIGATDRSAGSAVDPVVVTVGSSRPPRSSRRVVAVVRGLRGRRPVPRPAALPPSRPFSRGGRSCRC